MGISGHLLSVTGGGAAVRSLPPQLPGTTDGAVVGKQHAIRNRLSNKMQAVCRAWNL